MEIVIGKCLEEVCLEEVGYQRPLCGLSGPRINFNGIQLPVLLL